MNGVWQWSHLAGRHTVHGQRGKPRKLRARTVGEHTIMRPLNGCWRLLPGAGQASAQKGPSAYFGRMHASMRAQKSLRARLLKSVFLCGCFFLCRYVGSRDQVAVRGYGNQHCEWRLAPGGVHQGCLQVRNQAQRPMGHCVQQRVEANQFRGCLQVMCTLIVTFSVGCTLV